MHRKIFYFLVFIAATILIYIIANFSLTSKALPPLSEYIASSTPSISTSTVLSAIFQEEATTTPDPTPEAPTIKIKAPKAIISAYLATTSDAMSQGLGDRESLEPEHGMFFILPKAIKPAFWMKNMLFPIDIVWINSTKKVVSISKNIQVSSYPNTFSPKVSVKYVLELNAGMSKKFGIVTGTVLSF